MQKFKLLIPFVLFISSVAVHAKEIGKTEVEKLLADWVSSQNHQNFEEYSKLYGANFKGTKKVGKETFDFDRKDWLEDRAKMFKKKFSVVIDSLRIQDAAVGFHVGFFQKWESKSYSDRGWKDLKVVDEGGSARIVEERMKYSEKTIATPKTFQELLAKTEEVDISWIEQLKLTPSEKGVEFSFVRSLGEGGEETYSGLYRNDGTLAHVTQAVEYLEHSMGSGNRNIKGKLTREYSSLGKLEKVDGEEKIENIESGKILENRKIVKLTEKVKDNFDIKLPPLKAPVELLK